MDLYEKVRKKAMDRRREVSPDTEGLVSRVMQQVMWGLAQEEGIDLALEALEEELKESRAGTQRLLNEIMVAMPLRDACEEIRALKVGSPLSLSGAWTRDTIDKVVEILARHFPRGEARLGKEEEG